MLPPSVRRIKYLAPIFWEIKAKIEVNSCSFFQLTVFLQQLNKIYGHRNEALTYVTHVTTNNWYFHTCSQLIKTLSSEAELKIMIKSSLHKLNQVYVVHLVSHLQAPGFIKSELYFRLLLFREGGGRRHLPAT